MAKNKFEDERATRATLSPHRGCGMSASGTRDDAFVRNYLQRRPTTMAVP